MDLAKLIQGIGLHHAAGPPPEGVRVSDLTEDSRTAVTGSLFIARAGTAQDGKRFVGDARRAGACAVVTDDASLDFHGLTVLVADDVTQATAEIAERFFGGPTQLLKLIGVTGTNGKSTVAHVAHHLLNHAGQRCGLIGTIEIDDGREVAPASMTTPPALELSRTLATMHEHGCGWCAMEVSSHALDQKRAAGLSFDVGVFTNLTGDHQDYHVSMEAYAAAKRRLFGLVVSGGTAVVNADDPASEGMVEDFDGPVIRCRADDERDADAWVELHDESPAGSELTLHGPWGEAEVLLKLHGRHNAMNALQAVAASYVVGLPAGAVVPALNAVRPPAGRLERVEIEAVGVPLPAVYVDFAHSDDALRAALEGLRPVVPEGARLWAVFGCGGEKDRSKRPRMGSIAAELADRVIVTSDNPRSEQPSEIIDEVLTGISDRDRRRVDVQARRERAVLAAVRGARPNDVVLLAGKGHETTQEIAGADGTVIAVPFDDREHARAALLARLREAQVAGPA
ncbi:MAG: UDP-N-acetylmuramoyl-L-alanyl-D-glutamate--2,6-diaminopimelate ligase [Planctomycetota bacterium]